MPSHKSSVTLLLTLFCLLVGPVPFLTQLYHILELWKPERCWPSGLENRVNPELIELPPCIFSSLAPPHCLWRYKPDGHIKVFSSSLWTGRTTWQYNYWCLAHGALIGEQMGNIPLAELGFLPDSREFYAGFLVWWFLKSMLNVLESQLWILPK